ncbi:MAG: hypothetical protein ABH873_02100 [Candidatus Firestonebacteria bacterium]
MDVPPGSTFFMRTGIVTCKNVIVPLDVGVFAYETLETLNKLIIDLNQEFKIKSNLMMVLLKSNFSKYQAKEIEELVKNFLVNNNLPMVKIFTVPFSRKIYESQMQGLPISHYAPHANIGKVYERITKELLNYTM